MTNAEKIATIETLLRDLANLSAHLRNAPRSRWAVASTSPSEVTEAEAAALHRVARIVGVSLKTYAGVQPKPDPPLPLNLRSEAAPRR
ncbi:hypothetical protein HDF16_005242 [Granulicella aggregans]|uniref:Uncharacterized protein n=1 Tax=Granulicella aggregans TaxID=474949 RepID=A0A7W7ZJU4_9BACT|nr:hypothetical protein [Granulicella aggregans]